MKSTPLIINWHDQNNPIYSAHFEPQGKGRLATAGGDNNVRVSWDLALWFPIYRVDSVLTTPLYLALED